MKLLDAPYAIVEGKTKEIAPQQFPKTPKTGRSTTQASMGTGVGAQIRACTSRLSSTTVCLFVKSSALAHLSSRKSHRRLGL
jgi:hypothetical protein